MSIDKEAVKELVKATIVASEKVVKEAKFDRTFKGRVTKILDNNKYTITASGVDYTITCLYALGLNEIVYVTAMENNFNNLLVEPVNKKMSDSQANNYWLEVTEVIGNEEFYFSKAYANKPLYTVQNKVGVTIEPITNPSGLYVGGKVSSGVTPTERTIIVCYCYNYGG